MVSGGQGHGNHTGIGEPWAQWLNETSAASWAGIGTQVHQFHLALFFLFLKRQDPSIIKSSSAFLSLHF